jgi:hypothetical protein
MVLLRRQITIVSDSVVNRIARAIARAEGYFVSGSLPNRLNNPGSLKDPNTGQLRAFSTVEEGWAALKQQVARMLEGTSAFYKPSMTIAQIAAIYTGGDKPDAWARIVAGELGVSPDTPIGDVPA